MASEERALRALLAQTLTRFPSPWRSVLGYSEDAEVYKVISANGTVVCECQRKDEADLIVELSEVVEAEVHRTRRTIFLMGGKTYTPPRLPNW